MKKHPVFITVCDQKDIEQHKTHGMMFTDGSLVCRVDGLELELDAHALYAKNPKRFMYRDANGDFRWSRWYVRSIVLDQKPVKKPK